MHTPVITAQNEAAREARHVTRIEKPVRRPRWNETHHGLTWQDMPDQSETAVTSKKLLFALYRAGATTPEEDFFINQRRAQGGAN